MGVRSHFGGWPVADAADLAHAAQLGPEKAVEYLRGKRLQVTGRWTELDAAAHARAFTVANVTKLDVLESIHQELQRAQQQGLPFEQFKANLIPRLAKKGWFAAEGQPVFVPEPGAAADPATGELATTRKRLTARRLQTIFQVNMQSSFMAGRYRELMANVDNRPWFQYVAVMDSRTRPAHRAMNGRVFRYDDPAIGVFWPPCGWNCRCRMRARSDGQLQREGLTPENTQGRIRRETITARDGTQQVVHRYTAADGQVFAPDPGFGANPAALQAVDRLAIARAPLVLGPRQGQAELRRLFTARQRMADLDNFVATAREARQALPDAQQLRASVGALDEAAAFRLADEGVAFDAAAPVTLSNELVRATAGQVAPERWAEVPAALAWGAAYWSPAERALIYMGADEAEAEVLRVSVRVGAEDGNRVEAVRVMPRQAAVEGLTLVRRALGREDR